MFLLIKLLSFTIHNFKPNELNVCRVDKNADGQIIEEEIKEVGISIALFFTFNLQT